MICVIPARPISRGKIYMITKSQNTQKDHPAPKIEKQKKWLQRLWKDIQQLWKEIKDRFTGDNLVGSGTMIAYLYPEIETMIGGKARTNLAGKSEVDKWRVRSIKLNMLSNGWFFFSSRGARAPKGNNMLARIFDAMRHPNESAVYFRRIIQIPVQILSIISNIEKGFAGMKPGGMKAERIRLASAAIIIAGGAFSLSGMFGGEKNADAILSEKEQKQLTEIEKIHNKESNSRGIFSKIAHPYRVVKFACIRHPRLVIGTIIDTLLNLSQLAESILVKKEKEQSAYMRGIEEIGNKQKKSYSKLRNASLANLTLDISINYYGWAQMIKDEKKIHTQKAISVQQR